MRRFLAIGLLLCLITGHVFSSGSGEKKAGETAGGGQSVKPGGTNPDNQAKESAAEPGSVSSGRLFTVNNGAEPKTLDPHFAQSLCELRLALNMFEGLLSYDPETAIPVPALADSWEVSEDGKTYTFNLRAAAWSDGAPINAHSVAQSLLRVLDPALSCPNA